MWLRDVEKITPKVSSDDNEIQPIDSEKEYKQYQSEEDKELRERYKKYSQQKEKIDLIPLDELKRNEDRVLGAVRSSTKEEIIDRGIVVLKILNRTWIAFTAPTIVKKFLPNNNEGNSDNELFTIEKGLIPLLDELKKDTKEFYDNYQKSVEILKSVDVSFVEEEKLKKLLENLRDKANKFIEKDVRGNLRELALLDYDSYRQKFVEDNYSKLRFLTEILQGAISQYKQGIAGKKLEKKIEDNMLRFEVGRSFCRLASLDDISDAPKELKDTCANFLEKINELNSEEFFISSKEKESQTKEGLDNQETEERLLDEDLKKIVNDLEKKVDKYYKEKQTLQNQLTEILTGVPQEDAEKQTQLEAKIQQQNQEQQALQIQPAYGTPGSSNK
ncbi:16493_t:CDS:2 [Entrophospora sp. SA101]|nr:16493_t:CDS:2 [Entrophospora sp. SA101]CAJ0845816.1 4346_t:CDS:2 [Entrophospora sp. SA101]